MKKAGCNLRPAFLVDMTHYSLANEHLTEKSDPALDGLDRRNGQNADCFSIMSMV